MPISTRFIAESIKAARKQKGLTQRELSQRTKIPQSHLSKIENGTVDLHISSLLEIVRFLDLELMLVPRALVMTVNALQRPAALKDNGEQIPLYSLDLEENQNG